MIKFIPMLVMMFWMIRCSDVSSDIRLNQLGYYPRAVKRFAVVGSTDHAFEVRDETEKTVFSGKLTDRGIWEKSGEEVKIGDFSALEKPGRYSIYVRETGVSHPFEIKEDLYRDVLHAAMKSYYYLRASMPLEERYAGKWARPAGHPDDRVYYHPSTGKTEGFMTSPKGWYDAGDYNKYVVNAGITVGTLLAAYELFPSMLPDGALLIPESGNGRSDLLDEVRYELEWVLTMQDDDGGVFVKVTAEKFEDFVKPHEAASKRYVVGKSTAGALDFAAITAQAGRVYRKYDEVFARDCLDAARRAWTWAVNNDAVIYTNPEGIATGEYGDKDLSDEFLGAAAELYTTTGESDYVDYIAGSYKTPRIGAGDSWRKFNSNLGYFSLITHSSTCPPMLRERIGSSFVSIADSLLGAMEKIPYRVPLEVFHWGSNSDFLNHGLMMAFAYQLTRDPKYIDGSIEVMDYIFGKNATGYSFVTGYGERTPRHIHHRPSGTDDIPEPIPGYVAGGPNNERQDDISKVSWGVTYPNKMPAKSYVDLVGSYASNEIAINWNAPFVFMLGFLEMNQEK